MIFNQFINKLKKEQVNLREVSHWSAENFKQVFQWAKPLNNITLLKWLQTHNGASPSTASAGSVKTSKASKTLPNHKSTNDAKTKPQSKRQARKIPLRKLPKPKQPTNQSAVTAAFSALIKTRDAGKISNVDAVIKAMRTLQSCSPKDIEKRWPHKWADLPKARLQQMENAGAKTAHLQRHIRECGIYTAFAAWKKSSSGYCAALAAWCRCMRISQQPINSPTRIGVECFQRLFRNGDTFEQYISHVRVCYQWLQMPLGALKPRETRALIAGAKKTTDPNVHRPKYGATAKQTKQLVKFLRKKGLHDVASSFVICRQYALRYKSEMVPLQWQSPTSYVEIENKYVTIHTVRKTHPTKLEPIQRGCICTIHGPELCGACILRAKAQNDQHGFVLQNIDYASALIWLREGAAHLNWQDATRWGTHAFRRGYGREQFAKLGLIGLMAAGGWKSHAAAIGYLHAKQKSHLSAMEFCIDQSDEEEDW